MRNHGVGRHDPIKRYLYTWWIYGRSETGVLQETSEMGVGEGSGSEGVDPDRTALGLKDRLGS